MAVYIQALPLMLNADSLSIRQIRGQSIFVEGDPWSLFLKNRLGKENWL